MSVNLMSAIFKTEFRDLQDADGNTTKASTAKFVCIALADHANDDGEGAYPSLSKIAYKTSLSRTAVINAIDALKHNGILIATGASKYETINYTVNPLCFVSNGQPGLLVNWVDSPSQPGLPPPVNRVDPNHTLTIPEPSTDDSFPEPTTTKKKGDIFDGMAFYAKQAEERGVDKVEELLTRLDKGIGANISRSLANQSVAKRLLKEEKEGRTVDQFLRWLRSDEWRMAHLYIYADLEKVWTIWPQAFVEQSDGTGPKPHAL